MRNLFELVANPANFLYRALDEAHRAAEGKSSSTQANPTLKLRATPRDPGWSSTGAPQIHSISSVRHRGGGGKYQTIRGKNLQTIQSVELRRVHAANAITTELPILEQTSDGRVMKVEVPDAAGINFAQGRRLFLTDQQPWSYEFGPSDIGSHRRRQLGAPKVSAFQARVRANPALFRTRAEAEGVQGNPPPTVGITPAAGPGPWGSFQYMGGQWPWAAGAPIPGRYWNPGRTYGFPSTKRLLFRPGNPGFVRSPNIGFHHPDANPAFPPTHIHHFRPPTANPMFWPTSDWGSFRHPRANPELLMMVDGKMPYNYGQPGDRQLHPWRYAPNPTVLAVGNPAAKDVIGMQYPDVAIRRSVRFRNPRGGQEMRASISGVTIPTAAGFFCPKGQYIYCKDGPCRCVEGARHWKWWEKRPSPLWP